MNPKILKFGKYSDWRSGEMGTKSLLKYFMIVALMTNIGLINSTAYAAEKLERSGLWGGIDVGGGYVERSFSGIEEDETNFFLGVKGGYAFNPYILAGLELSGWLFESSNLDDSSEGEGLSQVLLITRLYPSKDYGFFGKLGGGYVSYWNNRPGVSDSDGWGVTFGAGYDFSIYRNMAIAPLITYSFGEGDDLEHDAITFGLSFTWQ
jgi:hypothetical protein